MNKQAMWEARRQEVMSRHSGCGNCGKENTQIHVHHRYYEAGKEDWDYPNESLEALCPRCHAHADELRRKMVRATGMLDEGIAMRSMGYMHALAADSEGVEEISILSYEHAYGVGDAYMLSVDVVLSLECNGKVAIVDLVKSGGRAWEHHR